ncbi:MAG: hypothetical protein JWQ87_2289 [Candidatus Sulfotelmatobacter sp.]|nr:hypothetical protein [Candidatus Sulfotelmatobacter sp.]
MNLEQIVKELEAERARIDAAIKVLRGTPTATSSPKTNPQQRSTPKKKGKPMSEAAKAKLRSIYAKNHPGWKPKKK